MAHKDFRGFLGAVEASGDLVTINDEIDWDQELSGMGRLSCERNGPAFLFTNIKDYGSQFRVVTNPIATWRRLAVGLGLPADTPLRRLYQIYAEREDQMIPPILVNDAPCKEVIIPGDKVDLFDLPVPMVHEGDGGRYLGTWDLVVSKDANTDWVNWGTYRFMVHNERLLT
ncbi:MAG TPA: UbiD family decarboxylase, partial [Xanthobacteraceae bacterium]|nr:UbiD family decarboxylase [Xanthobacteraceae bacterium]